MEKNETRRIIDICVAAASMIVLLLLLYQTIVVVPLVAIVVFVTTLSVIKNKKWFFLLFFFATFFPWFLTNEVIIIFDRQFSVLIIVTISISISFYVFTNRKTIAEDVLFHDLVLDIIIAFMFWGMAIIRTMESYGSIAGMALCVLVLIWSEYFVRLCGLCIEKCNDNVYRLVRQGNEDKYSFLFILLFLMLIFGVCISIVYYPGIITRDCAIIYNDAKNISDISHRTDIHSFSWTLIISLLNSIFHNYYSITLFLVICFSFSWIYYMKVLYKCGLSREAIIGLTILWWLVPGNWYYFICSWKDIPFTVCMLLVSAIICKVMFDDRKSISHYICLVFASLGMALFRSNGQVVLGFLFVTAVICFLLKKKCKELVICLAISLSMLIIIKVPIFNALGVSDAPEGLYTLPYIDGIWENVHKEVLLSDDTIEFIESEIMPLDDFRASYESGYTNRYCFPKGFEGISLDKAKKAYTDCLKLHPFITISARLKRTYNIWGIMLDSEYPVDRNIIESIPEFGDISSEYHWTFLPRFEFMRKKISELSFGGYIYGFLAIMASRNGTCILVWMLAIRCCKKNRGKLVFILLPPLINTLVFMFGSCYADYRYVYPNYIVTIPFIGVYIISQGNFLGDIKKKNERG